MFTVEFVDNDSYNPKVLDQVFTTPIDIDGNDKLKEFSDVNMMGGSPIFSGVGTDASVNPQKRMAYYRLLMVDKDGKTKYLEVKLIGFAKQKESLSILTYPNPVSNELRIIIPNSWQGKEVKFDIFNSNGQLVKTIRNGYASQTETITVNHLTKGFYVVKAGNGIEIAQQPIIKN